jgi:hypothetical protein
MQVNVENVSKNVTLAGQRFHAPPISGIEPFPTGDFGNDLDRQVQIAQPIHILAQHAAEQDHLVDPTQKKNRCQATRFPFFLRENFTSINDQGQIVFGEADDGSIQVWQNGTITTLLTLSQCGGDCQPDAINNSLQMVGHSTSGVNRFAFLYTNGSVYHLNDLIPSGSGWDLAGPTAMNDLGQITGVGLFNGVLHAFRLDPASLCTAPTISSASSSPSQIWPPNRQLVPVSISYTGSSSCDPSSYSLSVAGGSGNGSSVVVDAHNVQLRADQGAVYTITISGTNPAGTGTASVQVIVPHDQHGK